MSPAIIRCEWLLPYLWGCGRSWSGWFDPGLGSRQRGLRAGGAGGRLGSLLLRWLLLTVTAALPCTVLVVIHGAVQRQQPVVHLVPIDGTQCRNTVLTWLIVVDIQAECITPLYVVSGRACCWCCVSRQCVGFYWWLLQTQNWLCCVFLIGLWARLRITIEGLKTALIQS